MASFVTSIRFSNAVYSFCTTAVRAMSTNVMLNPKDDAKEIVMKYLDGKDNGIAVLGLNRPAARNAFGRTLIDRSAEQCCFLC